jgi:PAS domain S-box-containing protein
VTNNAHRVDPADPIPTSRQSAALRNAGIACFEYWPASADNPSGSLWHWSGNHFGITGIETANDPACLIAAASEADRPSLAALLTPSTGDSARSGEFRLPMANGHSIHLYCEVYCETDQQRRTRVLFGTVQNITAQQKFEAELTQTVHRNHMLLATIDACPFSITVADTTQPDLPIIYANQKFYEITGYEASEVLGRNCRFLQGPASDKQVVARFREAIAARKQTELQVINYRKDGSTFFNRLLLVPIHDPLGYLTAYIGLQTDMTVEVRREAEDQRQKMEALGRMVGGVAHEINNMLQPVLMIGQDMLDRNLVVAEGQSNLEVVLECSRRARDIIADLLAFSRPTARALTDHDLLVLLDEALRTARTAIPPGVRLAVHTVGPYPPVVVIDRTMFVQILINLIGNAVAAMSGQGDLVITLDEDTLESTEALRDQTAPRFARLRVIDTGCGMDRLTRDRAFEPFFTTKPIGQGTGLGLPIVYGLIREIGGTVAIESEVGLGTTVTLLLPGHDRESGYGGNTHH